MNLQIVTQGANGGSSAMVGICCMRCNVVRSVEQGMYADLDGHRFLDYYCPDCAKRTA